ncbi:MAG: hypothetical protein LBS82_06330 [Spirochaetaceae bacterium]|jgi:hypothetical protein|nr:hypothetical protein [Spirochaetaceae bacterium]
MRAALLAGVLVMAAAAAPDGAKLFALGRGEAQKESPAGGGLPAGARRIQGRVLIYGNEPHTYAGIETTDGKRYAVFPPDKEQEIRSAQGSLVEFVVVFAEKPQGYGALFLRDGSVTPLSWRILDD